MAAVVTTATHPRLLWPGLYLLWGTIYPEHEQEWTQLFDQRDSTKAYELLQELIGMGLTPAKGEGVAADFDATAQGVTNTATHVAYALGGIITQEALDDNQYKDKGTDIVTNLKFSQKQTKEIVMANMYNRAMTAGYTFADGKTIIATDHPTAAGNQSNRLASNAPLSEVALEDMCIQIMNAETSRGHKFGCMPESLHTSVSDYFRAIRILKSAQQNNTTNNAINALKFSGMFPKGAIVNHYFDSTTAWFVRTNVPNGAIHFKRKALELTQDNEFDTKNARFLSYQRYSAIFGDWRHLYGSSGA